MLKLVSRAPRNWKILESFACKGFAQHFDPAPVHHVLNNTGRTSMKQANLASFFGSKGNAGDKKVLHTLLFTADAL